MSDREESPERQENGSHRSNEESADRGSESPARRSRSRSRSPRQRSRSKSPRKRSRSRSRSRSRRYSRHQRDPSRSRSRSPKYRRYARGRSPHDGYERRGGSRYGNYSDYRHRSDYRDHSRSPMSSRRRHVGNRENPPTGRCLGIFGLSIYTQERDLKEVFTKYGPIDEVQIVYDAQSGRSRGFAFVYFEAPEDAAMAKERCNGIEIDGRKIRVDFSITQRAHTPTPGIYMGKPTYSGPRYRGGGEGGRGGGSESRGSGGGGGGGGGGGRYESRRSPSPYYSREKRRYSRSRSRSHSPRKYHYY